MRGKKKNSKLRNENMLKDPNERKKVFNLLKQHLKQGLSLQCFEPLSDTSIKTYLKNYPEEFIQEEFDDAMRAGRHYWETLGKRQSEGSCMGNSRTWYYNMANRYGWRDKIEIEAEHKGSLNVNVVNFSHAKPSTQ